jgi:hypothetical protein
MRSELAQLQKDESLLLARYEAAFEPNALEEAVTSTGRMSRPAATKSSTRHVRAGQRDGLYPRGQFWTKGSPFSGPSWRKSRWRWKISAETILIMREKQTVTGQVPGRYLHPAIRAARDKGGPHADKARKKQSHQRRGPRHAYDLSPGALPDACLRVCSFGVLVWKLYTIQIRDHDLL